MNNQTMETDNSCNHAYKIKRGPLLFCLQCKQFIKAEKEDRECTELQLPPEIYNITEKLWQKVSPWPLMPFETVKRYGWYITIIGLDDYLVMPVLRDGVPVFYSARCLTKRGGKKYHYQTGAKKHYWISNDKMESPIVLCEGVADAAYTANVADSIAILGNFYDSSVDSYLVDKRVLVALDGDAIGFTSAVRIAKQLKQAGVKEVEVISLPDNQDPTDIPLQELKEMLYA